MNIMVKREKQAIISTRSGYQRNERNM